MNSTIKTKLLLNSGLSILLLLVVATLSILEIDRDSARLEHVARNSAFKVKLLSDINQNVTNIGRQQRNLLLAKTPQEKERSLATIQECRTRNNEKLEKISGMLVTEQGRKLLAQVNQARSLYSANFDPFFRLQASDPEAAREYLVGDFKKSETQYKRSLDQFIVFIDKLMESTTQEALDSAAKSKALMVAAMLLGAASSAGFALWILSSVTKSLTGINFAITRIRDENDFRENIRIQYRDEVGETAFAFNGLLASLRKTLRELKEAIAAVDAEAHGLETHAHESSQVADVNSSAAASMAAAVEQMSVSISHVADNARDAMSMASEAGNLAGEGSQIISDAVRDMHKISDSVREFSLVINELGAQSGQVSSIVRIIREVADQTNLLALNAAIEAARAGESGRGFAVVADEVRQLAERTASSANEISVMIAKMQSNTHQALDSMSRTEAQVVEGASRAQQAGDSIARIRGSAESVASAVREITAAIAEQESASQQIAQSVEKVAQASEETSATARSTAEAALTLDKTADRMLQFVNRYAI